jgi:MerR family transcriptional regulator, light-induced transcriptional regulator
MTARLTGVSADLIRAWERRYAVVSPVRGPRGARLYTAEDVRRLRVLGRLVGTGRRIGDLARLPTRELEALATTAAPDTVADGDRELDRVLAALARFDADAVARELGEALIALGAGAFVHQVATPLLAEAGARWEAGRLSVAEEHLLSAVLRDLLGALVHGRPRPADAPRIVLAAPSGERHELGLVMVALLARDAGVSVCFLGVDLAGEEIARAAARSDAAVVGLALVHGGNRERAAGAVRHLARALPRTTELWLGGRDAGETSRLVPRARALVLDGLDRVEPELRRVAGYAGGR